MTMLTNVAATLVGCAMAAAEASRETSREQTAAQPPSAAQFILVFSGIALGVYALLACTHDPKRLAAERREDDNHRRLINRVSLFGTEGTQRPSGSTFAHSKRDEYDAAAEFNKRYNSTRSYR